jgi:hypothetical protein
MPAAGFLARASGTGETKAGLTWRTLMLPVNMLEVRWYCFINEMARRLA